MILDPNKLQLTQVNTMPADSDGEVRQDRVAEPAPESPENDLFFLSTQMQSRHEEITEQERNESSINRKLQVLRSFTNEPQSESSNEVAKFISSNIPTKPPAKRTRPTTIKTPKKKAKNQSMNSLVRDTFSNKLSYFSGDQTKIDDFLKRINKVGDLNKITASNSSVYTKEEWIYILKNIKLKFPDLPSGRKKTLKTITRKIDRIKEGLHHDNSLWSQASAPVISMTEDELKWLYDVTDEPSLGNSSNIEDDTIGDSQDDRQFVLTLSFNDNENNNGGVFTDDDNDIPNKSTPEDNNSFKIISANEDVQSVQELSASDKKAAGSPEYIEVVSDSEFESDVLIDTSILLRKPEEPVKDEMSSHQRETLFEPLASMYSFPFAESIPKENTKDTQVFEIIESTNTTAKSSPAKAVDVPIEFITSGLSPVKRNDSLSSPFKTPTKRVSVLTSPSKNKKSPLTGWLPSPLKSINTISIAKTVDVIPESLVSSPAETTPKGSKLRENFFSIIPKSTESVKHPEEIIISSEDEPIYSTARSRLSHPAEPEDSEVTSSLPTRNRKGIKRKLLHTSRYEVKSDFVVPNWQDSQVQIRNLGPRKEKLDSDNEIPDSEDENDDYSIIEIIRVENSGSDEDRNTSVLQVPSSPVAEGILNYLPDTQSSNPSPKESYQALPNGQQSTNFPTQESLDLPTQLSYNIPDLSMIDTQYSQSQSQSQSQNEFVSPVTVISPVTRQTPLANEILPENEETFADLSMAELKDLFALWELKPVRGKQKMIAILQETSKLLSHSNHANTAEVQADMTRTLNEILQSNRYWHEKVISYEPIKIEKLQQWLQSQGYQIEVEILTKYCDRQGITCTNQR